MKKNTKILICGLGAIGQRHYKNLITLGYKNIIVYRTGKGVNKGYVDAFSKEYKPTVFHDLVQALKEKPEIVFVTNPSSLHAKTALAAAKVGAHVFVEKPLSHMVDSDLKKLQKMLKEKKRILFVGYNLRFHPLLIKIKKIVDSGHIGKPLSANVCMGERVSGWHPWENYKKSYSSRKDLGGGVVLTQSHDLDYLSWLFGSVLSVTAKGGTRGAMGITADDIADILISYTSGVEALVHIDYLQTPPVKNLSIVGTEGSLNWDYFEGKVVLHRYNREKPEIFHQPKGFDRNDTFVDETKYFMSCIDKKQTPFNDMEESVRFLQFLLAIKKQLHYGNKK